MQFSFKELIGRNLKVYIDDIMIKSMKSCNLISHLLETFNNLQCFNIKLNLEKCTFGIPWGKLLGCIITKWSIEANLDKISAIAGMGLIKNGKDVNRRMGCLAALSRFVSRLGECGLLLYKLLKKSDSFYRMEEA
jgi:hypothetical protein